jgi:hypothetical protein
LTGLDDATEYSPESIFYWIVNWPMLVAATEGGTGSSGLGSGRGGRMSLVCLKADLEHAADQLPIYWQATEYIFRRQRRGELFYNRRTNYPSIPLEDRQYEPPIPSDALEQACYRMAISLGWRPGLTNVA